MVITKIKSDFVKVCQGQENDDDEGEDLLSMICSSDSCAGSPEAILTISIV